MHSISIVVYMHYVDEKRPMKEKRHLVYGIFDLQTFFWSLGGFDWLIRSNVCFVLQSKFRWHSEAISSSHTFSYISLNIFIQKKQSFITYNFPKIYKFKFLKLKFVDVFSWDVYFRSFISIRCRGYDDVRHSLNHTLIAPIYTNSFN